MGVQVLFLGNAVNSSSSLQSFLWVWYFNVNQSVCTWNKQNQKKKIIMRDTQFSYHSQIGFFLCVCCVCLCSLKKMIGCLPPSQTRHFQSQPGFSAGGTEHGQYSGAQASHSPYGVTQSQHTSPFASSQPVPANYASGSQLRGTLFVFSLSSYD